MFTIRQIHPSGCDFIWEAEFVSVESNPDREPVTSEDQPQMLCATLPGGPPLRLESGSVYVMNDNGKTVAKYDLGGWAEPQEQFAPAA